MHLKFYRQKATELKTEGFVYYSGEDGQPYVDDKVIIVADGLGGTGSMKHSSINPGVLDEETALSTFFGDMYEHIDECFVSYFKNSFKELFLLKDIYCKTPHAYKSSAYIGSRIVSSIMLYHLSHDEDFLPEKLFGDYAALDEESKDEYVKSLAEKIKAIIKADINKVAENANIIRESDSKDLEIMATTLCSTIYLEHEDYVEAFYFISGDSRPYVWSLTNGLQQVVSDRENADGGMNDCIVADGDFSIVCKYLKYDKPCVLFNASDGCFDSGAFISPLAFEKLILDGFIQSGSIEETEQRFISDFETFGTHDDSSTLALTTFGYPSFESLQYDLVQRNEKIKTDYFDKFEGLLEANLAENYAKHELRLKVKIAGMRREFEKEEAVWSYCEAKVLEGGPIEPDPEDKFDPEEAKKIDSLKEDGLAIIEKDILPFIDYIKDEYTVADADDIKACEKLRGEIIDFISQHRDAICTMIQTLDHSVPKIREILTRTLDAGVPDSFDNFEDIDYSFVKKDNDFNKINEIQKFFHDMCNKSYYRIFKIDKRIGKYREACREIIRENPDLLEKIWDKLMQKSFDVAADVLNEGDLEILYDFVCQIVEIKNNIANFEKMRYERTVERLKREYWKNKYVEIIIELCRNPQSRIGEELRSKVVTILDDFDNTTAELKGRADAQSAILNDYDLIYSKIMRGE